MLILLGIVVGIILVIIKIPIPKYSLHKIDRSRLGNELYPWEDVIKCKDYEFKSPRFNELIELRNIECPKCICENREKKMIYCFRSVFE